MSEGEGSVKTVSPFNYRERVFFLLNGIVDSRGTNIRALKINYLFPPFEILPAARS